MARCSSNPGTSPPPRSSDPLIASRPAAATRTPSSPAVDRARAGAERHGARAPAVSPTIPPHAATRTDRPSGGRGGPGLLPLPRCLRVRAGRSPLARKSAARRARQSIDSSRAKLEPLPAQDLIHILDRVLDSAISARAMARAESPQGSPPGERLPRRAGGDAQCSFATTRAGPSLSSPTLRREKLFRALLATVPGRLPLVEDGSGRAWKVHGPSFKRRSWMPRTWTSIRPSSFPYP
jgi:hypothetical protein